MTNNGVNVGSGDTVSVADINAGYLIYMPTTNMSGSPFATWTFEVQDDGGTAWDPETQTMGQDTDPDPKTMTINVPWVNQAPSFSASNPPAVDMCADPVAISNWASFNPGGGPEEASQTATYTVTIVSNPDLFSVAPTVAADGTLTYTVAPYVHGTATFDVTVQDDGGTANGGSDTSATLTFAVQVRPNFLPITVNTTNDTPATAGNLAAGRALDADGNTSLRAALQVAYEAARPGSPAIYISFNPNMMGQTIGLQTPLPDLAGTIDLTGLGYANLLVTRSAAAPFRIFTVVGTVRISALTISNGNSAGANNAGSGGGIANFRSLILNDLVLEDNRANDRGGAIFNVGTSLTIQHCFINRNQAVRRGGGIFVDDGKVDIFGDSEIARNSAGAGGGIYIQPTGNVTIYEGTRLYINTATGTPPGVDIGNFGFGGAIANLGALTISDAHLWSNASIYQGGGVCSISDNHAAVAGNGICVDATRAFCDLGENNQIDDDIAEDPSPP
ncbi:MAG: Ig-like domain-containing protein [Planctomycetes bacterium]|nr:Ig-like domain-containing protein [Planctomycetota bacterium]